MKSAFALALGTMLLSISTFGCKDEVTTGILTGDIQGVVFLRNGDVDIADRSGVTVTIGTLVFRGVSNPDGTWKIEGLPTGTYTVSFSKPGFGIYKVFSYQFVGGGMTYYPDQYLFRVATHNVTSLAATDTAGYLRVTGRFASVPNHRYAILFWDTTANVSPDRHVFHSMIYAQSDSAFTDVFGNYIFNHYRLTTGTPVYLMGYGCGTYEPGYFDPSTRKYVFTTLSSTPSNTVRTEVP